jgi:hypothetical protein
MKAWMDQVSVWTLTNTRDRYFLSMLLTGQYTYNFQSQETMGWQNFATNTPLRHVVKVLPPCLPPMKILMMRDQVSAWTLAVDTRRISLALSLSTHGILRYVYSNSCYLNTRLKIRFRPSQSLATTILSKIRPSLACCSVFTQGLANPYFILLQGMKADFR